MRKFFAASFLIVACGASASPLSGIAGNALVGGLGGLDGSSLGLPPVFGDTSVSMQCKPFDIGNLDLPNLDLCKTANALSSLVNKGLAFKIGPCDLSGGNPLECNAKSVKDYCADRLNKPAREIASEIRTGENNLEDQGRANIAITGGDQYGKNNLCGSIESTLNQTPEKNIAQKSVTKLSGTPAYGPIINTRAYSNSAQCYEMALKSKVSQADAARFCSPQSIGASTSNKTGGDIQVASYKNATETLASPLRKAASSSFNDEAKLKNDIYSKCGMLEDESAIEACASGVVKNKYGMGTKMQATVASIESKEAGRSELFEQATAHRKSITHPTSEYANTLPIQNRASYAGAAKKSLAQDALVSSFNRRISGTKKELAKLMMQKTELMAKPYYDAAERKKINGDLASNKAN